MLWPLYPREITLIRIEYGPGDEGSLSELFEEGKNFFLLQKFEPRTSQSVNYIVPGIADKSLARLTSQCILFDVRIFRSMLVLLYK